VSVPEVKERLLNVFPQVLGLQLEPVPEKIKQYLLTEVVEE
jgi:hypothetical protein